MSDTHARQRLAAEAAYWYARLRDVDVSKQDVARFRAWLGGGATRRSEFRAVARFWAELRAIEMSPEIERVRSRVRARRRASTNIPGTVIHGP